jgi:nicotinate dehydrogenase subunit A
MIMTTKALLDRNPSPSEAQVRLELSGNLCRCGTHIEILRAVLRAARLMNVD